MSNASASYPELFNAYTTTGFPLALILSNSSSAFSGVIIIQSIFESVSASDSGKIRSGLIIGCELYSNSLGVLLQALRLIVRR